MELAFLYGCPRVEAIQRTPPSEYPLWLALFQIHKEERDA
jgi:hypothetical protein